MKNILYVGPKEHFDEVVNNLKDYVLYWATEESEVDAILPKCEVIIDAYMKVPFNTQRLKIAKKLELVVTATTGADHFDIKYLEANNIPIKTLKGQEHITQNLTPAAEHSWLLLMSVARQLRAAVEEIQNLEWDRNKFPGLMLKGKTIGIIGCGRIGGWMSKYAEAFGMQVLGYDPFKDDLQAPFVKSSLDDLLKKSDFVSIHVPLLDETKNLINTQHFKIMKDTAIIVNTSRGDIINQDALVDAINKNIILGAGLDVISGEPDIKNNPLLKIAKNNKRIVITPHIGGFSPDALNIVLDFTCSRIKDYYK